VNYEEYRFCPREILTFGMTGACLGAIIAYLFYGSFYVSLVLAPLSALAYLRWKKGALIRERRWQLMVEFKDGMDSLLAALVAGYSMDHAVEEARKDLLLMYGKETLITEEFAHICHKLKLKIQLDDLLTDLGRRSQVEDIVTFAAIYSTARRSGGNLVQVMKRTANNIGEKMDIQREIMTMVAGKKMEANCMMVIPLLIVVYLNLFSPEFLAPLYGNLVGAAFMTACLILYGLAFLWSRKIMDIQT